MDDEKSLQQLEQEKAEIVKVEYELPKFHHKILAKFIDIIIFFFVFFALFIGFRSIVTNSGMYRYNDLTYKTIEIESALFVNSNTNPEHTYEYGDEVTPIITYLPAQDKLTYNAIVHRCHVAIMRFIDFLDPVNHQAAVEVASEYKTKCLALKGTVLGHENYFVLEEDCDPLHSDILEGIGLAIPLNPTNADIPYYPYLNYFVNFYRPFIGDTLIDTYLVRNFPVLQECIRNEGKYVFFIEFPSAYIGSAILVFFIPTLIFRRGRKTLGRLLYRIGYVDPKYFSPGFWRNLLRFTILLFAEFILSVFTFGLPFIISFTVMVFTKKKQNFPDYILGLTEVDNVKQKIYYNKIEALSDKASIYKKAPDFKLPNL